MSHLHYLYAAMPCTWIPSYLLRHEAGNPVYTYDAHGNMTTMPHLTAITWNYADLLRSASNGTFTSYYVYNAGGGRTRKVVVKENIREERVYLGNYELYRKYVNNTLDTERQTLHVADDQHRFTLIDRLTVNNGVTLTTRTVAVRYQYDNHLGSASLELDQNAAIISYEEYHPFGTTSYRSGRTETEVTLKRYKYAGKERDEERRSPREHLKKSITCEQTGLYYYGARYYAAWIARFVSVDPLQLKYPHYTPYQYAGNKPVSYIDLDGLEEATLPDTYKAMSNDNIMGVSLGIKLGINVGLGTNGINFNATISAGIEYKTSNFQSVVFASASVYGGQQLGTSSMTKGMQYDLTVGAYATIGNSTGSSHNFYTLNYNTASPFDNTFDTSFTYGQMLTYNSAINALGDGPKTQSQGLVGMRFGENFSLSTNNDANSYGSYLFFNKNNKTDAGWTGGIVLNVGGVEAGYQNYSGYWPEFGSKGKEYGYVFSAENRMNTGQNGDYHQSLNKAFNFVRKDGFTAGFYSGAWFQQAIHKYFPNDGTYIYNNQGHVNGTIGQ